MLCTPTPGYNCSGCVNSNDPSDWVISFRFSRYDACDIRLTIHLTSHCRNTRKQRHSSQRIQLALHLLSQPWINWMPGSRATPSWTFTLPSRLQWSLRRRNWIATTPSQTYLRATALPWVRDCVLPLAAFLILFHSVAPWPEARVLSWSAVGAGVDWCCGELDLRRVHGLIWDRRHAVCIWRSSGWTISLRPITAADVALYRMAMMLMAKMTSGTSPWAKLLLDGARSMSTWLSPLNMSRMHLLGGLAKSMSFQSCQGWPEIIWVSQVSLTPRSDSAYSCGLLATSTAVERVFSRGRHLLHFTRNWLSASSLQAHLCLGSWAQHDLYRAEDILRAVGSNKRKRLVVEENSEAGSSK